MKDSSRDDEDAIEPAGALRSMAGGDDEPAVERAVAGILRRARPELARRRHLTAVRRRTPAVVALVLTGTFSIGAVAGVIVERARNEGKGPPIRADVSPRARSGETDALDLPGSFGEGGPALAGHPSGAAFPPDMVELLDLEPGQRAEVESALARHDGKVRAAYRDTAPDIERADAELDRELRSILDDVQRERYELIRRVAPGRVRDLSPR